MNFIIPTWNELVIYELHVGSFYRSSNNHVGTFYDVIEKLSYLQDLGINAIELLPVSEFSGDVNWGYAPSHLFAVEYSYGGVLGLKKLVDEAHSRGIAIILDVVYNHLGPSELEMWRFDGWCEGNGGGIYFYNDDYKSKTPWGNTRPDFGRDEVRQLIKDNAMMWLEEYQIDGLRLDSSVNIRRFDGNDRNSENKDAIYTLKYVNQTIKDKLPWKILIAEDLQNEASLVNGLEENGYGFDSQWDSSFVFPIREVIIGSVDEQRDMNAVVHAISFQYNSDAFSRVIYTESHDETANGKSRVTEEIAPNEGSNNHYSRMRANLGAGLVFTSPGIPMLFQGQEFLEDKWFDDNKSIDWEKVNEQCGALLLYKQLISLRRNLGGKTKGLSGHFTKIQHVHHDNKVIAYHRCENGGPCDSVIIIANFKDLAQNNYILGVPEAGSWVVRFNSGWEGYDKSSNNDTLSLTSVSWEQESDGLQQSISVNLSPYAMLILSRD